MSKLQIKTSFTEGVTLVSGGNRESNGKLCPCGLQPETMSFIQGSRVPF